VATSPPHASHYPSVHLFLLALQVGVCAIRDHNPNQHHGIQSDSAHGSKAALFRAARPSGDLVCGGGLGLGVVGSTFESADKQAMEDLAGFVGVANVFERFGGVLAANVEEDFFAAAVWKERKVLVRVLRLAERRE
jgi:hypothetical protein